jgi:hypothetical protein
VGTSEATHDLLIVCARSMQVAQIGVESMLLKPKEIGAMATKRLEQLLAQLQQEVEGLDAGKVGEKARLDALIAETKLALGEETMDAQATILEELRTKIAEFEVEHPTATGIAQRLMQTLSDMGI